MDPTLEDLLRPKALTIHRAQAHLFGLLPPGGGAAWELDLQTLRFVARLGDTILLEGPVQVVGTWSKLDGLWRWGDRDPNVCPAAFEPLFARLREHAAFDPIRSQSQLRMDDRSAGQLATLCAAETGWFAAWPAPTESAVTWLAVTPVVWPGTPVETTDRAWCTLCGRVRKEVRTLIAGPGVMICDACITLLVDVGAERGTGSSPAGAPAGMPPCAFCGEDRPRTFGAYAAVCHACTKLCADMLRGAS